MSTLANSHNLVMDGTLNTCQLRLLLQDERIVPVILRQVLLQPGLEFRLSRPELLDGSERQYSPRGGRAAGGRRKHADILRIARRGGILERLRHDPICLVGDELMIQFVKPCQDNIVLFIRREQTVLPLDTEHLRLGRIGLLLYTVQLAFQPLGHLGSCLRTGGEVVVRELCDQVVDHTRGGLWRGTEKSYVDDSRARFDLYLQMFRECFECPSPSLGSVLEWKT